MIGLNDMDQKVCDQDAEKKKESRNSMDNQEEGNWYRWRWQSFNKRRCEKQTDIVVINWSDSVRSCVHKKETGVTVQENDASYKCNVTHVKKDREPISVNKVCEPNDVYVESSKSDARCVSYIAPC